MCFARLAVNNVLLFVDPVIAPNVDLSVLCGLVGLVAMSLLVIG